MHWPKDKNNQMFFCFATNKFSPYNHVQLPQQHPLPYYPGPRPSWMEEEGRSLLDPPSTMAGSRFWFTNSCTDSPWTGTFATGRHGGPFIRDFPQQKMGQNSPQNKKTRHRRRPKPWRIPVFLHLHHLKNLGILVFCFFNLNFFWEIWRRQLLLETSTWPRSNLAALWAPRVGIAWLHKSGLRMFRFFWKRVTSGDVWEHHPQQNFCVFQKKNKPP